MSTKEEAEAKFGNPMPQQVQQQYDEAVGLVTPKPDAPAAPAPGNDGPAPTPAQPSPTPAPATTQQPAPAAPATPAPEPVPEEDIEVWKQRAKVFQGRLAAQAHKDAELRAAQARIAELERERQAGGGPKPAAAPATPAPVQQHPAAKPARSYKAKDITDDEVKQEYDAESIEDYGMDFLKHQIARDRTLSERLQAQIAAGHVGTNGSGMDAERQELRELIQRQREDRFFSDLTQMCPSWEQLSAHAQFNAFELEIEPRSGIAYGQLIRMAKEQGDALRVLPILEDFRVRVNGPARPQQTPASPAQPHVMKILPSVSEQASVTGVAPAGPASSAPKPVYSPDQFDEMRKQMSLLENSDPAKAKQLYDELISAVTEGRVQGVVG